LARALRYHQQMAMGGWQMRLIISKDPEYWKSGTQERSMDDAGANKFIGTASMRSKMKSKKFCS